MLRNEVLLVLGVSLLASGVWAVLRLAERLTRGVALAEQTAAMNVSRAERPWLDLLYQLAGIAIAVVPALLALHLLNRYPGDGPRLIGLDLRRVDFDLPVGVGLTALIGVPGLMLYVVALWAGIGVTVAPANLQFTLWLAVPVLILAAVQNALLEEVVGVGYLLTRLRELGWHAAAAVGVHALLRGSYHLYQGIGAFVGNAVMGVVFALFFLRFRRVLPLVVAHTLLDVAAFVGYGIFAEEIDRTLADLLDWLPGR